MHPSVSADHQHCLPYQLPSSSPGIEQEIEFEIAFEGNENNSYWGDLVQTAGRVALTWDVDAVPLAVCMKVNGKHVLWLVGMGILNQASDWIDTLHTSSVHDSR
jgi:hypothetical protein